MSAAERQARRTLDPVQWTRAAGGAWRCSTGRRGERVVVQERADRGLRLELRYRAPDGRRVKVMTQQLGPTWRERLRAGPADGLDAAGKAWCATLVLEFWQALRGGEDPLARLAAPVVDELALAPAPPLTLRAGVERALPELPVEGPHPGGMCAISTERTRRRRAAALQAVEVFERACGATLTWDALRHEHWTQFGARLVEQLATAATRERPGHRLLEEWVDELTAVGRWLREHDLVRDYRPPPREFIGARQADLTQRTGYDATPSRPRYAPEHQRRLLQGTLDHTLAIEPRLRLAVRLGAELRGGQVRRCRRSQLELDGGLHGLGVLRVPSVGRKRGATIALDADDRALVDWALTGYLQVLERAYQARALDDYALFPGGSLAGGVATMAQGRVPVNARFFTRAMRRLEAAVGLPHQRGRAWYGMRRALADHADELGAPARARLLVSGWTGEGVRQRYLDPDAIGLAREVSELRRRARGSTAPPEAPPTA